MCGGDGYAGGTEPPPGDWSTVTAGTPPGLGVSVHGREGGLWFGGLIPEDISENP